MSVVTQHGSGIEYLGDTLEESWTCGVFLKIT